MRILFVLGSAIFFVIFFISACSHNGTLHGERRPSSESDLIESPPHPTLVWENDICVLKGASKSQDYIVRFNDIHNSCPALRDYAPAGAAYLKLKNFGRGAHLPSCSPQPALSKTLAARCWLGFDVFGESLGACTLAPPQSPCSACQCDGRKGISWAH